jgi:hypothetical protein
MEGALFYSARQWYVYREQRGASIEHYPHGRRRMPHPPGLTPVRALIPSAQELADLRRAVKRALALNDKRGFDYFAGWPGLPLGWCQHHDALFLPWHRAYLYWLELALQSEVPGVTLPWWD